MLTRRELRGVDRPLFSAALLLLIIGFLTLYSASFQKAQATGVSFVNRQLLWAAIGGFLAVVLVVVDYHRWLDLAYILYGINMVFLIVVLEWGVVRGGAQRWLSFGGLTIQPSELAKVTTILAMARFCGARRELAGEWKGVFYAGLFALIPMVLILKQPNLGTALVFGVIALGMLFVWGIPVRILWTLIGMILITLPVGWFKMADYQHSRLLVFLNPNLDPLGAGYTVVQSKIAIGSGCLFGKGWLSGTQNQLNFLPERHTDFIFSVVGEEWGFFGTTLCLFLFGFLFYRTLLIATQTTDPFGRLLIVGLVTMLAMHLVVNIGMTLGLMPVVGLPLPLLSYGGSWLLTCLVSIGMILSVGARRPVF